MNHREVIEFELKFLDTALQNEEYVMHHHRFKKMKEALTYCLNLLNTKSKIVPEEFTNILIDNPIKMTRHEGDKKVSPYRKGWNACRQQVITGLMGLKERLPGIIEKTLKDDVLPSGAKKWVLHGSWEMFKNELSQAILKEIGVEDKCQYPQYDNKEGDMAL